MIIMLAIVGLVAPIREFAVLGSITSTSTTQTPLTKSPLL